MAFWQWLAASRQGVRGNWWTLVVVCCVSILLSVRGQATISNGSSNVGLQPKGPIRLRLLVLLPYKTGQYAFPFGAEMCGAASKYHTDLPCTCILTSYMLSYHIWTDTFLFFLIVTCNGQID